MRRSAARHTGRLGVHLEAVDTSVSLTDAVHDFLGFHRRKQSAPRTIEEYNGYLVAPHKRGADSLLVWAGARGVNSLGALDRAACSAWLEHCRERGSASTYGKCVVILKRFFNFLIDEEVLVVAPLRLVEPRRTQGEIAVFTDAEMERIAKVVRHENVRDWAILMLWLDSGLRAGELCDLTLETVRLDRKEVHVSGETSKTRRSRIVPLKASIGPLRAYLKERSERADPPWFFLSFAGSPVWAGGRASSSRRTSPKSLGSYLSAAPLTRIGLYALVRKWGRLAGITEARCSPHTFRHYFAVTYLRQGGDVFTLRDILGHAKLEMTLRYSKLAGTDVRRAHNIASPAQKFLPARQRRLETP